MMLSKMQMTSINTTSSIWMDSFPESRMMRDFITLPARLRTAGERSSRIREDTGVKTAQWLIAISIPPIWSKLSFLTSANQSMWISLERTEPPLWEWQLKNLWTKFQSKTCIHYSFLRIFMVIPWVASFHSCNRPLRSRLLVTVG